MTTPKMPTEKRDYYEVLGVDRNVAAEEIKRAYRKLAVKFHPDKNPGDPHAEEKFKELGEAYDVLMDGDKRAAYDRFGHAAFSQGGGSPFRAGFHDPFDIFREVFGMGGESGGGGIFDQIFGTGAGSRIAAAGNGELICATTCRSRLKRRLSAPKRRSSFSSMNPATGAMAQGPRPGRVRLPARLVTAGGR